MEVIYTVLGPDKKPQIHTVRPGEHPAEAALRCGLENSVWSYCKDKETAQRMIDFDPNGKMEPI